MMSESQMRIKMDDRRASEIPEWLVEGEYRSLGREGLLAAMETTVEEKKPRRRGFWHLPRRKGVRA